MDEKSHQVTASSPDPPPQALNKLNISQYAVCQPVLRRPVWPFRTLHIEHIQRIMTFECRPVQVISVGSEVCEQRRDTQGQRAHPEWLVPPPSQKYCPQCQNRAQEPCLSLCTRSASIAAKTRLYTTVRAQEMMASANFHKHTYTRYSCNFARTTSTFPLWGDGRSRAQWENKDTCLEKQLRCAWSRKPSSRAAELSELTQGILLRHSSYMHQLEQDGQCSTQYGGARVNSTEVIRSLQLFACLETQVFEDNVHGVIVQDINL